MLGNNGSRVDDSPRRSAQPEYLPLLRRILSEVLRRKNGVVQPEWPGRSTSDRIH